MSYNGSGVYNLPGSQLASGETVSANENNQFRNDVAAALNVVLCRDGQSLPTANLPMNGFKLTGLAAGTANGDSVRYEQATSNVAITGGTISGVELTSSSIDGTPVGAATPDTGSFTTVDCVDLTVSGSISGAAFDDYLLTPPPIGTTTPNLGAFTKLEAISFLDKKSALAGTDVDMSQGAYFTKTLSADTTFTVSNIPSNTDVTYLILDITNGGSYAVTWWNNVEWAGGGLPPILTFNGRDILGFYTFNGGTTWVGLVIAKSVE